MKKIKPLQMDLQAPGKAWGENSVQIVLVITDHKNGKLFKDKITGW